MTSYVVVQCDNPLLDIRTIQNQDVLTAVLGGAELRWNRDGDIRRIPRPVLTQVYAQYRDHLKLVDASRLSEVMAAAHTIEWDQAEPLAQSEVSLDPRPRVAHRSRQARGKNTPAD